jgi:hypothetical protein
VYVSNAVTVPAAAAGIVVLTAPAAVTVAVVIATITANAAGNVVGGGGGVELMGLALSCTKHTRNKIDERNTCTCFASHFDGHAGQAV